MRSSVRDMLNSSTTTLWRSDRWDISNNTVLKTRKKESKIDVNWTLHNLTIQRLLL